MMTDVTRIFNATEQRDARAAGELLPLVYEKLRILAAQKLSRQRLGQTLQPTAKVHEAYIRLTEEGANQIWNSRRHFFRAAAEFTTVHGSKEIRAQTSKRMGMCYVNK